MSVRHGGDIYSFERDLIDFSSNINPLGPPAAVKKCLEGAEDNIVRYPDREYRKLKEALAKKHGVKPEQILPGNGAAELIYLLGRLFRGKKAVIPIPTFSEYAHVLKINDGLPIPVERRESENFIPPLRTAAEKLRKADGIFLCRPNNPAGELLSQKELDELLPREESLIISDESFLDFMPCAEKKSLISRMGEHKNLAVLRSATKFYALPGLRLGYLVARKELITELEKCQPPWSVNSIACCVGRKIYDQEDFQIKTKKWLRKEAAFLEDSLGSITGLKIYSSRANFILARLVSGSASILRQRMAKKGLLIRDAASFSGLDHRYFRVAVKDRHQNQMLVDALKETVARLLDNEE